MIKEFFRRNIQFLFSSFIFDIPPFNKLKILVLKMFFLIGRNVWIGRGTIFYSPHSTKNSKLVIGNNVSIEHHCDIDFSGGLSIENDVWISEKVLITTHKHDILHIKPKKNQSISFLPLVIKEDVWIGANSIILDSVKIIGKGSIIGAGSVVRKRTREFEIIIGNPAEKVGTRFNF